MPDFVAVVQRQPAAADVCSGAGVAGVDAAQGTCFQQPAALAVLEVVVVVEEFAVVENGGVLSTHFADGVHQRLADAAAPVAHRDADGDVLPVVRRATGGGGEAVEVGEVVDGFTDAEALFVDVVMAARTAVEGKAALFGEGF